MSVGCRRPRAILREAEFLELLFVKAEMMADLVQQRHLDFVLEFRVGLAGVNQWFEKENHARRELWSVVEVSLRQRRAFVESKQVFVVGNAEFAQQLPRGSALDQDDDLIDMRMKHLRQTADCMARDLAKASDRHDSLFSSVRELRYFTGVALSLSANLAPSP